MQKIIRIGIFSLLCLNVFAQPKKLGYTAERISRIENLFYQDCNGKKSYCDCIIDGVTENIPFNDLRNPSSKTMINRIIRDCQEKYKQFPYDPANPPKLSITTSMKFNPRSSSTLFEGDSLELRYQIRNEGRGIAYIPSLVIAIDSEKDEKFIYNRRIDLEDLAAGEKHSGTEKIFIKKLTSNNEVKLSAEIIDGNKYRSNREVIQLQSYSSDNSNKRISFFAKKSFDGIKYDVDFTIKNIGKTPIRFPKLNFELEKGALVTKTSYISIETDDLYKFVFDISRYPLIDSSKAKVLYPGEEIFGDFQFELEQGFEKDKIELTSRFTDSFGWIVSESSTIEVKNTALDQMVSIKNGRSTLSNYVGTTEVDKVERISSSKENHFALVIGNENYSGAYKVDFAEHDAGIFKKYCTHLLGVPENQAELVLNGSAVQMKTAISNIIVKAQQREAPVIYFYYAGHGWPDPNTDEPLLIPVDVGVNQLGDALKLNYIMEQFRNLEDADLFAFVDACYASEKFSPNTRTFERRKVVPLVKGNQVLFSAVSAQEEANKHEESHHGVFTYYLLELIKSEKGITVRKLNEELRKKVVDYTTDKGQQRQIPSLHIDGEYETNIEKWQVRRSK